MSKQNMIRNLIGMTLITVTTVSFAQIEMRPRPSDEKDFPEYIEYLVEVSHPRTAEERKSDDGIKARYKDVLVLDPLFVGGPGFPAGFSEEQYEEFTQHSADNDFNVVSATISNGSEGYEDVLKRINYVNRYWKDHGDKYLQVKTIDDMSEAKKQGKLGIFHNFQSMDALDKDVGNVQKYYDLGVRQMNFTYNVDTDLAAGCGSNSDGTDTGLTELGQQIVVEMNRVGMVIDASHSSNQTAIDVAALTTKPMMLSHSNVATFQPIDRNSSDEAIKAVAATGGVICVNFIGGFLNPQGDATPYSVAKHAEYIKNLVGAQAVGAASDYVWNYGESLMMILKNPTKYPPEMGYASPSHMGLPGDVWGIAKELEDTFGWTEEEIRGFLGENVLRIYKANWK